jgi:GNAT superfamily N-acetyltransferase
VSGLCLRPARSTDAGRVGAILSQFIDATPWMPRLHSRAQDVAFAGRMIDKGWVTVAEVTPEDAVCGFLALDAGDVAALFVAAELRGSGIGSSLLGHAKAESAALSLWTFEANGGALRFYQRHGFRETARGDGTGNEEGLPDVRLEWRLETRGDAGE